MKVRDSVINDVTMTYVSTVSATTSIETMKEELMELIHTEFDEHNAVCDKAKKWRYPESLPPFSIAHLILASMHVKRIKWTNKADDEGYLSIYQDRGTNEGLYVGDNLTINSIIRKYNYTISSGDIEEVKTILREQAKSVIPNSDRDLIAVNNGIFDYRTKQLLSFSPDYIFTAKSKVDYVVNATNPHITMHDGVVWDVDSWFDSLSDDPEIVKLLWEVVGAIIRPHVRWDKIVCFYSQRGMNGKGTLCELMKQLCGEDSYSSIPLDAFSKDFRLEELVTSTAIITDENGTAEFTKNPANLKALTTGDSISIDRKYKSALKLKFSGLIVQCINSLPRTSDTTDSLYRRFLIVPFDKTFVGVERKYIKADYLHRQDVLQYILCKVLNTDYYSFSEPIACIEMLETYKEFNDPVRAFWNEVHDEFVWDFYPSKFLVDLFSSWSDKNKQGMNLGKTTFLNNLEQIAVADGWIRPKNQVDITDKRNGKPELLILDYSLVEWRAKSYKGNDPAKICMPDFKNKYYGFLRAGT